MSLNKVNQRLDRRVTNNIKTLNRYVRELKTPQKQGADVIAVQAVPSAGYLLGSNTIAAGDRGGFIVTGTPANSTLTLWNDLFTVSIDSSDTVGYGFPGGGLLTPSQRLVRFWHWIDWATSSDITNMRKFYFEIENLDSSSHTYYLSWRAYIPLLPGTSS